MSDKHIFISYSRKDGEPYVTELEKQLGAHHRVWRDIRDLRPDQDFTADIERNIEAASHVVVCLTPDTKRDNSYVRREIAYALAIKCPVIPVRCADITPHLAIINNELVDYFKNPDAAITRLLKIVSNSDYTNKPPDTTDDFRAYLEETLKLIVDGLDQRIIRLIDLKAAPTPDAVTFIPPPERNSVLKQAFSGVKKTEPEKPSQNFDNFLEGFKLYNERALLLGQPGAGKTITLMVYARDAYAARLDDPTQPLPLFGLVATWNPKIRPPLSDWLAESHNLDPNLLRAEIDAGHTLLLLDGLDELRAIDDPAVGTQRDAPETTDPRRDFLDTFPANNRILLTCRTQDYDHIDQKANLNGAITLRDLTTNQVGIYLTDQPHLLKLIEEDKDLRELTQTPLLLSIFAFAYRVMTEAEREQLRAIETIGELRDKIFTHYIEARYEHERKYGRTELSLTLDELKNALGHLAMRNVTEPGWYKQGQWRSISPNLIEVEWINTIEDIANADEVLNVAERLRLLARADGESYRFVHSLLRDTLAFAPAILGLSESDVPKRRQATKALGQIGDARAVEPLIAALDDTHTAIRIRAADALGQIGDTRAVEHLLTVLHDSEVNVRHHVALALGQIGDTRALESLIDALRDPDSDLRRSAAVALRQIGDTRAVESLINALHDPDAEVRRAASDVLRQIGKPAFKHLFNALHDPDAGVRRAVIYALGYPGKAPPVEPLINALRDPDADLRRSAAVALGRIGKPAVEALIVALSDPNVDVRGHAIDALVKIGSDHTIEPLIRRSATDALVQIGKPAIEPLISTLSNSDADVRRNTVIALGEIGDAHAVEPLVSALSDPDANVRYRAAIALGKIGEPAVEPLVSALSDRVANVRYSTAYALQQIGIRAIEPLINALSNPDANIRGSAAYALAEIGHTRAVEPLINALRDPNEDVQGSAVDALERLATPDALAAVAAFKRRKKLRQLWRWIK